MDISIIQEIVGVVARLNRHSFFKDKDMEEWMPFISGALYDSGVYVMPIGSAWCCKASKDMVKEYLDDNKELFEEYHKWAISQR